MGYEDWKHDLRNNQGSRGSAPATQRLVAPGKRTLTAGLSRQAGGASAPVQAKSDPADGEQRATRAAMTQQWLDVAVRPDLPPGPVQRKSAGAERDATTPAPSAGSGQSLPEDVQAKMEGALGADFSAVCVHEGPQATAMGALAYTQGADIHFAPGQYRPQSQDGQELLGHELTHVVQQSQGRVQTTTQAKGVGINDDAALEHEADDLGARAARGEKAHGVGSAPIAARGRSGGSVQRYAFVNDTQVEKDAPDLTAPMLAMVKDDQVRNYTGTDEFKQHASKSTDYLGNLSDGTWLRFSPTGINLVGENHTLVTLEQVVRRSAARASSTSRFRPTT